MQWGKKCVITVIISRHLQKSKVQNDAVNYNKCNLNFSQEITKEHKLARVHKKEVSNQNTVGLLLFLSSAAANPRFTLLLHIVAILRLL